jgi:hypothetical protein
MAGFSRHLSKTGWWWGDAVTIRYPVAGTGWLRLDKLNFSIVYVVVSDFVVLLLAETNRTHSN